MNECPITTDSTYKKAAAQKPVLNRPNEAPDLTKSADLRNLDRVLIRGVAWTAVVKWLTQVVTWGTTIIVGACSSIGLWLGRNGGNLYQFVYTV